MAPATPRGCTLNRSSPGPEGSAKTTYEAAACALAQITTRESGDVVEDGVNGVVIPPNDVDALAAAIQFLYDRPDLVRRYGAAGRERVLEQFTWDHFRERVLAAYRFAMDRASALAFGAMTPSLSQESGRFRGVIGFKTVGLRLDKLFACLNLRYRPLRSINFA